MPILIESNVILKFESDLEKENLIDGHYLLIIVNFNFSLTPLCTKPFYY